MRIELVNENANLSANKRLVRRIWKVDKSEDYPDGIEFSYQFLYLKDKEWIRIVRIDNQLHNNQPGTHIHIFHKENVLWENIEVRDVEKKITQLAEVIIKNVIERI